jgi:alkylated DNA repair dioxygenase AlkB
MASAGALLHHAMSLGAPYQPGLFDAADPTFDASFVGLERVELDDTAWIDLVPSWVASSDHLFEQLRTSLPWAQRERWIYDQRVREPRLTARWTLESGATLQPPILEHMRQALGARYGVAFDALGFNFYRDGRDSVAWHRDKIRSEVVRPIVPLLALGDRRKLLFRPRGGGPSRPFGIGRGDLLVTGGETQRTWEHAVPKVARSGPRISVAFRYGVDPRAYGAGASPAERRA